MDKFLETYTLLRQDHDETENLLRPILNKEIKSVITNFPAKKKKSPELDDFTDEFYQIFKEKLMPNLKIFWKIEEEAFSNWLYKTNIILIPKPGIDTTRKENYRPVSLRNTNGKIFNSLSTPNSTINHIIISTDAKKSIWQNSTSVYDKNSQQIEYRRNISLYRKNHKWQIHS